MTLSVRLRGAQRRRVISESQQRLSMKQEKELVGWILIQDSLGNPQTHRQVAAIAVSLLDPTDPPQTLGKHWLRSFITRHPERRSLRGKRIDLRVNGATTDRERPSSNSWPSRLSKISLQAGVIIWMKPALWRDLGLTAWCWDHPGNAIHFRKISWVDHSSWSYQRPWNRSASSHHLQGQVGSTTMVPAWPRAI